MPFRKMHFPKSIALLYGLPKFEETFVNPAGRRKMVVFALRGCHDRYFFLRRIDGALEDSKVDHYISDAAFGNSEN